MKYHKKIVLSIGLLLSFSITQACSMIFYIDPIDGKVYAINHEDYWLDTKANINIIPSRKNKLARLWYGWDGFAQGGINEAGLFFDAAVTPDDIMPSGFSNPNGKNIGDTLLANCKTVEEALQYFRDAKIAVSNNHLMFGDASGNAVIVEWIDGKENLIYIKDNVLIGTNYLLLKPEAGNYPCYRYQSIKERADVLQKSNKASDFKTIGNISSGAVQVPRKLDDGRELGTLYSSFFNITDMEMIIVPKLDNSRVMKINLKQKFKAGKKERIKL